MSQLIALYVKHRLVTKGIIENKIKSESRTLQDFYIERKARFQIWRLKCRQEVTMHELILFRLSWALSQPQHAVCKQPNTVKHSHTSYLHLWLI